MEDFGQIQPQDQQQEVVQIIDQIIDKIQFQEQDENRDINIQENKSKEQMENNKEAIFYDLTNMFKTDFKKPIKKLVQQQQEVKEENKVQNEVPRNLKITQDQMKQRRWLDQRRWFCISRPQYQRSCGISSLTSCFNYLFSTLGVGELAPISQEEAIEKLGIVKGDQLYKDVEFGSFTGNSTLIKWWKLLCKIYKVEGRSFMLWKAAGEGKTEGVDKEYAYQKLIEGLKSETTCFIYHAYDHYFCPIGFELTPKRPQDAYKSLDELKEDEYEPWIMIGEPAAFYTPMHIRKWSDIVQDITLENPKFYNIREHHKGVQERQNTSSQGGTLHCIMSFQKVIKKPKHQQDIQPKQTNDDTKKIKEADIKIEDEKLNLNIGEQKNNSEEINKIEFQEQNPQQSNNLINQPDISQIQKNNQTTEQNFDSILEIVNEIFIKAVQNSNLQNNIII